MLFVTPRKALARQVALRIRHALSRSLTVPTLLLANSKDLDDIPASGPIIVVAGPTPLLRRQLSQPSHFGSLDLILAHDLHALDPSYELLLSRLRWSHPDTRIVGSSTSLSDPSALASWLSVPEQATYNFAPTIRTSALTTTFQPFSTPHSAALLRSLVKPAYAAMRTASGSTICFVPSRAQCRATAKDLVTQTAADFEESFVDGSLDTIEAYAQSMSDPDLAEALTHGIAVYHEGLRPEEQRAALELFHTGAVRILIASREACWTLPLNASLVIVLSAQFAVVRTDAAANPNEREIKEYPLPELVQMQALAVPPRADATAEFLVLCQQDQAELYGRFLDQGLPLESQLAFDPLLSQTIFGDLVSSSSKVKTRQDVVDLLSWTFVSRQLEQNPSYYSTETTGGVVNVEDQLSRLADRLLGELEARCCLLFSGKVDFSTSLLGKLYNERGVQLNEVRRIQQIDLSTLVEKSRGGKRSANGVSNGNGTTIDQEEATPESDDPVKMFHQRLPRAVKDTIGEVSDGDEEEYRRRVLLGAFAAGRIPRGQSGLEEEQVALVRKLIGQV